MTIVTASDYASFKGMRMLGPTMVFVSASILMTVSIIGTTAAFLVYHIQKSYVILQVGQSLTILSSAVSFVFIGLYLLAARKNEPMSKARPPTLPLHSACIITMRIAALSWTAAMVAASGATFSLVYDQEVSEICLFQKIDMVVSILAIIAATAILLGLEKHDEPFKTPSAFRIRPRIVCRVSYFEDLLDRSVSRRGSSDDDGEIQPEDRIQTVPPQVAPISRTESLPGRFPHASTLSEDIEMVGKHSFHLFPACSTAKFGRVDRSRGLLQSEVRLSRNLEHDIRQKPIAHPSGEPLKLSPESSNSDSCVSLPQSGTRVNVSPSSSLGSSSRRSPLSTMRSVEDPDILIESDTRVCLVRPNSSAQQQVSRHHAVNRCITPVQSLHARSWRKRTSSAVLPTDLRKQTAQPRSVKAGMRDGLNENLIRRGVLRARMNENVPRPAESVLNLHSRRIEECIQVAVKVRMQQEQQFEEQVIRDKTTGEEPHEFQSTHQTDRK